jgi:hypothetical protein
MMSSISFIGYRDMTQRFDILQLHRKKCFKNTVNIVELHNILNLNFPLLMSKVRKIGLFCSHRKHNVKEVQDI